MYAGQQLGTGFKDQFTFNWAMTRSAASASTIG